MKDLGHFFYFQGLHLYKWVAGPLVPGTNWHLTHMHLSSYITKFAMWTYPESGLKWHKDKDSSYFAEQQLQTVYGH